MDQQTAAVGKRWVISDIHGCLKTFLGLLDKLSVNKEDKVYLLGDYIDRGPNCSGVIDHILELQFNGYQIFPLRGNHEENLIKAAQEYDEEWLHFYLKKYNSTDLLEKGRVKLKYMNFFQSLEYYYELDDFILVHAGMNFSIDNPFIDKVALLELRKTIPNKEFTKGKIIIHGHQPVYMKEIEKAVERRSEVIPLDNGCVYTKPHKIYDHTQLGKLCALNLDSFELITQENIE